MKIDQFLKRGRPPMKIDQFLNFRKERLLVKIDHFLKKAGCS
jgi:hypothetical protein